MFKFRRLVCYFFCGLTLIYHNNPVYAQIDISYIDKQIKESKTFEFDYYGNYDYLKNVADGKGISNLNNKLALNRNIEKIRWGNWQNVNFEISPLQQ